MAGKLTLRGKPEWLLLLDLDGTIWTHLNVSGLREPLTLVAPNLVVDASGEELELYGYMVELAAWARENGAMVCTLSWNEPEKALRVLELLGIEGLFDCHMIEPHPNKHLMLKRLLARLKGLGITFNPCRVIYVDDREIHLKDIVEEIGPINYIRAHRDCRGLQSCINLINRYLEACNRLIEA